MFALPLMLLAVLNAHQTNTIANVRPVFIAKSSSQRVHRHLVEKPKTISGALAVEVITEGTDDGFAAQVRIVNLETKEKNYIQTNSGQKPLLLKPGRYELYTEALRHGFPQEGKYDVIDAHTNAIVESFARSNVPVTNIVLKESQRLRVTIPPAIRPYNSVFYRLGPRRVPVAHLFTRPYPANDFGVGAFNGTEQFSAAPIAIAFLGTKAAREQPELAKQIAAHGVATIREGELATDPVLVLGVRAIAQDLAETFVAQRWHNDEDYRGKYHTTFLIQRTADGKVPPSLLSMKKEDLASEFERQLTWMMIHNVHRTTEGGGYAGKTFIEDLAEAKEKMTQWPEITERSTELWRRKVQTFTELGNQLGLDATTKDESGATLKIRDALRDDLKNLIKAAYREKLNDTSYDTDTLKQLEQTMGISIADRLTALKEMIKNGLDQLKQIAPGEETELLPLGKND